jgi:hypothetical protein
MGRDACFYCLDCKKYYYLGYGSYSTWLDDAKNVAGWEAAAALRPDVATLAKNQNMLACLRAHEQHNFQIHSNDWAREVNGNLVGELGPMGSDVVLFSLDGWEFIDMAPD